MDTTNGRFPHVPAGGGNAYHVIGELITIRLSSAQTGGVFAVTALLARPGGGPPLHTHPAAEVFLIQDGAFEFTGLDTGQPYIVRATPGETVFIPGGAPHTYQCVSPTPGRALGVLAPGGEMERFFAAVGTPVTDRSAPPPPAGPPSAAEIAAHVALAEQHGIVFLPPQAATGNDAGIAEAQHEC